MIEYTPIANLLAILSFQTEAQRVVFSPVPIFRRP